MLNASLLARLVRGFGANGIIAPIKHPQLARIRPLRTFDHAPDTTPRPERRKSKKLIPLYLQVSQMLKRIAYSRIPLGELEPLMTLRSKAKDLIACSALLL